MPAGGAGVDRARFAGWLIVLTLLAGWWFGVSQLAGSVL
jgi:hypothetical protein